MGGKEALREEVGSGEVAWPLRTNTALVEVQNTVLVEVQVWLQSPM